MKKLTLLLFGIWFSLLFFNARGSEKTVVLNGNGETKIQVLSEDKAGTVLEFNVNSYDLNAVQNLKANAYTVGLPRGSSILEKGAPDLSKLTASIIVSESNQMNIEIIATKYVEINNIDIAPSRGNLYRNMDIDKIPYKQGKVYQVDAFYPGKLAELRTPYVVRDFRGQTIITYPLQYNPVSKTLRIYTSIKVRVKETSLSGRNPLSIKNRQGVNQEFSALYAQQFMNYKAAKYEPVAESGRMLVVCPAAYMDAMQPFIDWKTKKGLSVEMVEFGTATGTSASALKSFVADYYANNGLSYLLLVGDSDDIPSLNSSGDSDVAYSYVSGDDHYPDFFVGRFSAENEANVASQVAKVIYYERDMDENATWLKNAIGIASDQGGSGQGDDGESDMQHMNNIKTDLTSFGYDNVAEVYDPGATASDVSSEVNEGVGIINYVGHGADNAWVTTGFNNANCDALTNVHMYPFIFDVACVNGNFHDQTCFAEAWSRATQNNEPTGSVAIIASTINQSWDPPMDGQDEMVDILVESYENNIKRSFGGIAYNGCMHMNDEYDAAGYEMTDTWTTFGDPSVMVRTSTPEQMAISHNNEILIGVSQLVVDADAENALACLSLNGEVLAVAKVSDGTAVLTFDPLTEVVDLDLVVTGYNKVTYQSTVSVIPADGPYLSVAAFEINDQNGSGTVEYDESFNIDLTLENVGTELSEGVTATITTDDPYVASVLNNEDIAFPNIPSGETATVTGQFNVQLQDSVPDQYMISFNVTITDNYTGKQTYTTTKKVKVNAPKIEFLGISFNDNFEGNNMNGILDAGETGEVIFTINNEGHADLLGINTELTLVAASDYLTLNTSIADLAALEQASPTKVRFNVTAAEETPLEEHIPVNIQVVGGPYQANYQTDVVIGEIPIYVMSNDIITSCSGTFLDSGNENAPYQNSENYTMTFKPSIDGNVLAFIFETFEVEEGYDYLHVYNGLTTDAEEIMGSPFSGSNAPTNIIATNPDGALTFVFNSDGYVNNNGWKASFECIDATALPECAINPLPTDGATDVSTALTLSWDAVSGAVSYDVYFGETLPNEPTAQVNSNYYSIPMVDAYTTYQWKVVPKNLNDEGPENDCGYWEFTTGTAVVVMNNGTVEACEGIFLDPMAYENYESDSEYTLTIKPDTEGKRTQVTFSAFAVETGYDWLKIFDGETTSANLIGTYDGTDYAAIGEDGVVVATNDAGALTFQFYSDNMVNYEGWEAEIACVDPPTYYTTTFEVIDMFGAVPGVIISVNDQYLMTDENGEAQLELVAGDYDYTVSSENHVFYEGSFTVDSNNVDVEVMLDRMFNVSFHVTDGESAIDNAVLTMGEDVYNSDPNGMLEMKMLPGTYNYTIEKTDYETIEGNVAIVDKDTTVEITMIFVGVGQHKIAFALYPNPNHGKFTVSGLTIKNITVYNSAGVKLVNNKPVTGNQISLGNLDAGLYIIQITTQNNNTFTQRIQIVD